MVVGRSYRTTQISKDGVTEQLAQEELRSRHEDREVGGTAAVSTRKIGPKAKANALILRISAPDPYFQLPTMSRHSGAWGKV